MKMNVITICLAVATMLTGVCVAANTSIDFEGAAVGTNNAADQIGGRLTTWGNNPGGTYDANIADDPAAGSSGETMYLANQDDMLLYLGSLTNIQEIDWTTAATTATGTVNISYDIYAGNGYAYWNVQSSNLNSNDWSIEIEYGKDGTGNTNKSGIYYYIGDINNYTESENVVFNQWVTVEQVLNIDDGTYTMKLDDVEVLSLGSSDGFTYYDGLLGIDFYGYDADSDYYVDNIAFNLETTVPEPMTMAFLGLGGLMLRRKK
ncbi:PEP-CTERM sorting domain-containing protein [Limihaloglobus sulfuriphilus]|nr:PEP-CTERM sorting domain-containing protein [Limihaloglobus sulfuriphilus]